MPLVSVIMGVYNCKNFVLLRNSVESVVNQIFTDWEFLICNDGSTDNTLEKLYEIEKIDSRIRILSYNENKGLANALNFCIEHAKGEYLARQDDDDISYPNRFEKQVQFLREHPEYAIVGALADVYDEGGIWGEYSALERPDRNSFLWNSPFAHPTIMVRAHAIKQSGKYRVAKETRRCEDYDLFMRMYSNGYIGYNIQEKLYKYMIVNNNIKYRPLKYRIDEAVVRWKGYISMKIILPKGIIFVVKPILLGLIPQRIFKYIRNKRY